MNKYIIATDLHFGAPNQLMPIAEAVEKIKYLKNRYPGATAISIGDNFDYANIKKKELSIWKDTEGKAWRPLFHRLIDGNHERRSKIDQSADDSDSIIRHGDFQFWGSEKAIEYRSKPQGAGFLKRGFVVNGIEFFEKHFESKIDDNFLWHASTLAIMSYKKRFICGHKHPDKLFTKEHRGILIQVAPRGISVL